MLAVSRNCKFGSNTRLSSRLKEFVQFFVRRVKAAEYGYRISDKYTLLICAFLSSIPKTIMKKCNVLDSEIGHILELSLNKALTFVDGVKFHVADYDSILVLSREHEAPITKYLDLKAGDVFVDVGAHVGKYALRIAKQKGCLVVAIEPSPKLYSALTKNVKLNKLSNVRPVNKAAYNTKAKLQLYGADSLSLCSLKEDYRMGFVEVEAEPLDDILNKLDIKGVKWAKIDVEGAEIEVLDGFRNTMTKDKPQIIIECHGENEEKVTSFMKNIGYQIDKVEGLPRYVYCTFAKSGLTECLPILTIAMPIYNRQHCIDKVLNSILSQSYLKEKIKLVFVDNFSTDGTFATLQKFAENERDKYLGISVLQVKSNIPQARNICLENAVGDYVLFWDSDVLSPDSEALERIVKSVLNDDETVAAGFPCYLDGKPKSLYAKIVNARVGKGITTSNGLGLSFMLLRRNVFHKIGLFNVESDFSEDTELFLRVKKAGLKVIIDGRTPCIHLKPKGEIPKYAHGYFKYVKRCFNQTLYEHDQILATGSLMPYLQLIVYLTFPAIIISSFFLSWLIALCYFLLLLMYQVYKARGDRLFGLITFAYYLLPGLATSYGYVYHKLAKGISLLINKARKTHRWRVHAHRS